MKLFEYVKPKYDKDEFKRSDFIDDSIVINFDIPIDVRQTINDYVEAVNNEDYFLAEDRMDDVWCDLKNTSKLTSEQKDLIKRKYKIW
ncbi:MAG: hypothetical protein IAC58_05380 [Firmicutes bacterium]|uniref:Uncharacterized protein n=1 Tax=Candidatus Onthovivens merdipullorum TaxID=2840889 RepID=A0A9D9DI36_9BACL|nr:hypothetical protein [Candidatus Onthovivens merdipullorum]